MFYFIFTAIIGAALIAMLTLILRKHRMHKSASQREYMPPTDLTEWDLRSMAYHEAGHAVCSYYLPEREKLLKITINPSDESFGMIQTLQRPHHNETKTSLMSCISTFLAGGMAEEKFLGTKTTSCIHDLAAAQSIAIDMVIKFGMGPELGFCALKNTDYFSVSERHKEQIIQDVSKILNEASQNAQKVLCEHEYVTKSLAERLLKKKTLDSHEIMCFFEECENAHESTH